EGEGRGTRALRWAPPPAGHRCHPAQCRPSSVAALPCLRLRQQTDGRCHHTDGFITHRLTWVGGVATTLPRKEVIQPQLPLRLPCYDFVPITSPALDGCPPGSPGWPTGFGCCRLS